MSYRIPECLLGPLRREIDLVLSMGIIEVSQSVLVPKKNGTLRYCIDFRYLNTMSKFDSYPTHCIDDLIDCLGGVKYLTTIDLSRGYWQVPLAQQSCELTTFRTPWGLFQFTVMPFELNCAPAPAKYTNARAEVGYFGHVIRNGVVKPQVQKVQAIQSCNFTTNKIINNFWLCQVGTTGLYQAILPELLYLQL